MIFLDAHWLPSQLCLHRGQRGQSAPPHRLGPQVLSDDVDVLVPQVLSDDVDVLGPQVLSDDVDVLVR